VASSPSLAEPTGRRLGGHPIAEVPSPLPPLVPRAVLGGPTLEAARAVLGTLLVRDGPGSERRIGRIVEVEAYIGVDDRACHARFGPTKRNRVMFGPPGRAYVYRVYGMYDCLNIVTEPDGVPAAILVRAIEPLLGLPAMRRSRAAVAAARHRWSADRAAGEAARVERLPAERLAAGPGLVGAVLGLDPSWSGVDLCDPASPLRLHGRLAGDEGSPIVAGPRVGVAYAGEPWRSLPWRLAVAGHPAVSTPLPGSRGRRRRPRP
jgi:DNA-3-methyladenine glycosylase